MTEGRALGDQPLGAAAGSPDASAVEEALLRIEDLSVAFPTRQSVLFAANRVSLTVERGRTLGIVGESGSGKTATVRSIVGLVPDPGEIVGGAVRWKGADLASMSERALTVVRGREIGMVFQDATASLNPLLSVGAQLTEVIRRALRMRRAAARAYAIELLDRVGIPSPAKRYHQYPHEFSGGMRQRAMIALAIAPRPDLLLADEPTTALDVTVQEQVLELLQDIQAETGMAMILVSHDIGVIARVCDEVAVMYAGYVVERGRTADLLTAPRHPYTVGLLAAVPRIDTPGNAAVPIVGQPPNLAELPSGCPFAPRCAHARPDCQEVPMTLVPAGADRATACPFP